MMIFLIGFMGSGKTTVGKRLAKALAMEFVDLDELVEQSSGKSITQLFEAGEKSFRVKETAVLKKTSSLQNVIVATGGGTPCFNENMTWMNRHGITIYIKMSTGSLYRRLSQAKEERPLVAGKKGDELKSFVEKVVAEREKYYIKALYTVKGEDLDIKSLAGWIREKQATFN
ncbi:MAG TPA: shikimate kinase [Bacteroidia bacterium]|nr:shikimate kinase [Bacteroidia bacterium]